MNTNIKFLPLWKNKIKNRGFYESIFPFLYSILSWFILGLPTEIKSFFVISLVFVISYIFTCLHLLVINFLVLIVLFMLDYLKFLDFSIESDTFIQSNVVVFTLILSLSLAIVTSNEYSRIVKYYIELYQGWNLLFFLAYLGVIIVSMLYSNNIVYILSIFMIMNSFVFIVNLAGQTSTEKIIDRLVSKLENEISEGHYSFTTIKKTSVKSSNINEFNVTTSIIDKHKEFEYNIDLLNQLAIKAFQNRDRDTFKRIIRGYLGIGRFFIMKCQDTDKNKVSYFLEQVLFLSHQAKQDDEFLDIILNELIIDFTLPILDIPIWNSQRFKLMVSIAKDNKESKERFNHIISSLIKMLFDMRGLEFETTEEYRELKEIIQSNQKIIDKSQITNDLERYKFTDVKKKKSFEEAKGEILKALEADP